MQTKNAWTFLTMTMKLPKMPRPNSRQRKALLRQLLKGRKPRPWRHSSSTSCLQAIWSCIPVGVAPSSVQCCSLGEAPWPPCRSPMILRPSCKNYASYSIKKSMQIWSRRSEQARQWASHWMRRTGQGRNWFCHLSMRTTVCVKCEFLMG